MPTKVLCVKSANKMFCTTKTKVIYESPLSLIRCPILFDNKQVWVVDRTFSKSIKFYVRTKVGVVSSMNPDKDKTELNNLVLKSQKGDKDAFSQIYDLFVNDIFRFSITIVRDVDVAEDVASETFMRAWKHLPSFKGGNFRSFLYTIAKNYAFDVLKKQSRTTALDADNTEDTDEVSPEDKVFASQEAKKLMEAIQNLSELYRLVITLRFMQELSIRETSEILNKSESAVKVAQHRAIKKLEKYLYE